MRKQIKQTGGSVGIIFNKEEQEVYDINVGKVFDIEMTEFKEDENESNNK